MGIFKNETLKAKNAGADKMYLPVLSVGLALRIQTAANSCQEAAPAVAIRGPKLLTRLLGCNDKHPAPGFLAVRIL